MQCGIFATTMTTGACRAWQGGSRVKKGVRKWSVLVDTGLFHKTAIICKGVFLHYLKKTNFVKHIWMYLSKPWKKSVRSVSTLSYDPTHFDWLARANFPAHWHFWNTKTYPIHQIALATLEMGCCMQGTDAHVPGGGDILARCAIALCRLGWGERGTFNWSLVFKNISRCHLRLSNIDCLMEMVFLASKLIWRKFQFLCKEFLFLCLNGCRV